MIPASIVRGARRTEVCRRVNDIVTGDAWVLAHEKIWSPLDFFFGIKAAICDPFSIPGPYL
jgi:hypothetical protein